MAESSDYSTPGAGSAPVAPAIPAASAPITSYAAGEEHEGLAATFLRRRIQLGTLDRSMRLLILLATTMFGLLALVLIIGVPSIQLITLVIGGALALGWSFLLAGALYAAWPFRFAIVALLTVTLGYAPLSWLLANGFADSASRLLHFAELGIVVGIWLWAIGMSVFGWLRRRRPVVSFRAGLTFGAVLALMLGFLEIELTLAHGALFTGSDTIRFQLTQLGSLILIFLVWASTDLVEWSFATANTAIGLMRRYTGFPILPPVATAGALVMLVLTVHQIQTSSYRISWMALLVDLVIVALLALALWLLLRWVRIERATPAQAPALALICGAVIIEGVPLLELALQRGWYDRFSADTLSVSRSAVEWLINQVIFLLLLPVGLALLAIGRSRRRSSAVVWGVMLVVLALSQIVMNLSVYLVALGLPLFYVPDPVDRNILKIATASAILVLALALVVRRRWTPASQRLLAALCVFLISLQIFDWLITLAYQFQLLQVRIALFGAVAFLATIVWDFIMSGEEITNRASRRLPREARVFLYLGYTLIASVAIVYFSLGSAVSRNIFSLEQLLASLIGWYQLGVPLIVVLLILLLMRAREPLPMPEVPRSPRRERLAWWGALGASGAMVALVAALIIAGLAPRLSHLSYRSPSVGCEGNNYALWLTSNASVGERCGLHSMTLTFGKGFSGMTMQVPHRFPANFDLSVRADLTHIGDDDCLFIVDYAVPSGAYVYDAVVPSTQQQDTYLYGVCASGVVEIVREDQIAGSTAPAIATLANGVIATPVTQVALHVHSQGWFRTFDINGTLLNTSDDVYLGTHMLALAANRSQQTPGSVAFSNFIFTPLDALPEQSPPAPPPGFRTYVSSNKVWSIGYPEEADIATNTLTAQGITAQTVQFAMVGVDDAALTVYDVPQVIASDQAQGIASSLIQAFGATDVRYTQSWTPVTYAGLGWQRLTMTATVGGEQFKIVVLYHVHGARSIVLGAAAPIDQYAGYDTYDFTPMVNTFAFLS